MALIALFVLSCIAAAPAGRYHHHDSSPSKIDPAKAGLSTACDFDADASQDRATLQANGFDKRVRIRFGDAHTADLAFATGSVDSGSLVAGDIDRDGDVDLVWVASSNRDAVILINDGEGAFAAAIDNSPYASELDDLFSSSEPSNHKRFKGGRRSSILASTTFHEVGLSVLTDFQTITVGPLPVPSREPLKVKSLFVRYLCKRGPPAVLS